MGQIIPRWEQYSHVVRAVDYGQIFITYGSQKYLHYYHNTRVFGIRPQTVHQ